MPLTPPELTQINRLLRQGEIIACPTEGVFGLSCDPFNEKAVTKLLALKQRSIEKGLILITHDWKRIAPYIENLEPAIWQKLKSATEHPTTWVLPARAEVPRWLCGEHNTLAVRLIAHPLASAICEAFGGPLISTSANLSGQVACVSDQEVEQQFGNQVAYIVRGETLGLNKPSQIIEATTGKLWRS